MSANRDILQFSQDTWLFHILPSLQINDIVRLATVHSTLRNIIQDTFLWKRLSQTVPVQIYADEQSSQHQVVRVNSKENLLHTMTDVLQSAAHVIRLHQIQTRFVFVPRVYTDIHIPSCKVILQGDSQVGLSTMYDTFTNMTQKAFTSYLNSNIVPRHPGGPNADMRKRIAGVRFLHKQDIERVPSKLKDLGAKKAAEVKIVPAELSQQHQSMPPQSKKPRTASSLSLFSSCFSSSASLEEHPPVRVLNTALAADIVAAAERIRQSYSVPKSCTSACSSSSSSSSSSSNFSNSPSQLYPHCHVHIYDKKSTLVDTPLSFSLYQGITTVIIVCDAASSLERIYVHLRELLRTCGRRRFVGFHKIVALNKVDILSNEDRLMLRSRILDTIQDLHQLYARENIPLKLQYCELSARTGEGIQDCVALALDLMAPELLDDYYS